MREEWRRSVSSIEILTGERNKIKNDIYKKPPNTGRFFAVYFPATGLFLGISFWEHEYFSGEKFLKSQLPASEVSQKDGPSTSLGKRVFHGRVRPWKPYLLDFYTYLCYT